VIRRRTAGPSFSPLVLGSAHQQVANPLLAAANRHRESLSRLLDALALPAEGEQAGATTRSKKARKAAAARWQRRDELRARRTSRGGDA